MGPVCGSGKRAQRPAEEETEEGKEKGRMGEKLTCGATWTEREKGERRERRARARGKAPTSGAQLAEGGRKRGEGARAGCSEGAGLGGPCGERRDGRGKCWAGVERRKGWWACAGRGRAGPRAFAAFFCFFFFPFFSPHLTIQTILFEFKPYTLHTNKTNAPA
ncbi:hypothetical protein GQ55_6G118700 [Panicum hallii var. hallii]|uniref:Uncharacterized protein n=1 Tax=Panicum hallii var. hallii TaxID=1504633 RepID=A0A2T7D5Y4_9POAL|nr:hypothetical protein GQ55_6G118700 [Panicum hallii var. hallii]